MIGRKGFGPVGFIFLMLFLIIMWPFVFAPQFNQACDNAVAAGAVGLEAFLWCNINLWMFLTLLIIIAVYFTFGGNQ